MKRKFLFFIETGEKVEFDFLFSIPIGEKTEPGKSVDNNRLLKENLKIKI